MRVIIAGGGTGGHLYPGIAVADELKVRSTANEILFVGTTRGLEARVVPKEGYQIRFLKAEGVVGKSIGTRLRALALFVVSLGEAHGIIRAFNPHIVIGVGGYASVGMVLAARLKRVPTLILEQNSIPGLANRFLSRFVNAIAVTYQESLASFPRHKTLLTGNPVRKMLLKKDGGAAYTVFPLARDRFTVFIFGGSAGAKSINAAAVDALNYLLDLRHTIQFLHQTGERDCERVMEVYRRRGFTGIVVPFIYQMAEAYALADLVICRAGATTLSEITAMAKPAVLIPYPFAAANHQEYNARKLVDMGAARMILDNDLTGETLARAIRELHARPELCREMQRSASSFARADAAERIVALVESLVKHTSR